MRDCDTIHVWIHRVRCQFRTQVISQTWIHRSCMMLQMHPLLILVELQCITLTLQVRRACQSTHGWHNSQQHSFSCCFSRAAQRSFFFRSSVTSWKIHGISCCDIESNDVLQNGQIALSAIAGVATPFSNLMKYYCDKMKEKETDVCFFHQKEPFLESETLEDLLHSSEADLHLIIDVRRTTDNINLIISSDKASNIRQWMLLFDFRLSQTHQLLPLLGDKWRAGVSDWGCRMERIHCVQARGTSLCHGSRSSIANWTT